MIRFGTLFPKLNLATEGVEAISIHLGEVPELVAAESQTRTDLCSGFNRKFSVTFWAFLFTLKAHWARDFCTVFFSLTFFFFIARKTSYLMSNLFRNMASCIDENCEKISAAFGPRCRLIAFSLMIKVWKTSFIGLKGWNSWLLLFHHKECDQRTACLLREYVRSRLASGVQRGELRPFEDNQHQLGKCKRWFHENLERLVLNLSTALLRLVNTVGHCRISWCVPYQNDANSSFLLL